MMVLHFDRFANCGAPITAQMKVGEVVQIGENYYLAIGAGAISLVVGLWTFSPREIKTIN